MIKYNYNISFADVAEWQTRKIQDLVGKSPVGVQVPPSAPNKIGGIKMLEKISYIILLTIVLIWILAIILGFIVAFPVGIIGFLFILAFGLLFIKVLKDKFSSKDEEEKYKDIKW